MANQQDASLPSLVSFGCLAQPMVQEEKVFEYLDDMPEFPGGGKAMMEWLGQNIQYPKEAVDAKVEDVMVSSVIEKDGSVSNAKVIRSIDPLLDNEAKSGQRYA